MNAPATRRTGPLGAAIHRIGVPPRDPIPRRETILAGGGGGSSGPAAPARGHDP